MQMATVLHHPEEVDEREMRCSGVMKHAIGLPDDYLVRQRPIGDVFCTRTRTL
jgi:hypothetical protein